MGPSSFKNANEGGGWFTWFFETKDISRNETNSGLEAIVGHRTRLTRSDLKWRRIGEIEIADTCEFSFLNQRFTVDRPSQDGTLIAEMEKIIIAEQDHLADF